MNRFSKIFIFGLAVVALAGFSKIGTTNAAAQSGSLIKRNGLTAVYYLGADNKRYVFPNESTYFSWYKDFSGIVTISQTELESYPLAANVTIRPGTRLVKNNTSPTIYAVEPGGVLHAIPSEAMIVALYGANWNQRVSNVVDSFFTNYTIGAPLVENQVPVGSLVKNTGNAAVYYYDGTNYRNILNETAFYANRFSFANVITISNTITAGGTAITANEFGNPDASATGPVVTGSGLVVALSASTPASMNIPASSPVEFLKINLTAANDGPINVSSIKLTAYGLSTATNIDDVTFYDNGVKVGTSKSINSDRVATFNFSTPIYVAAGTTKVLSVKATIAVASGSYGLGIASASDITCSGATISGSFPITGNLMSAVESSVGGVTVTDTDASDSVSFGEDNILLADFTVAADNTENALLDSISLYNGGTNADDIVSNLKLFIDGTERATGVYADRYATFSLNNYEIEQGDTVSVEVRGDIGVTSINDTIKLYLKDNGDFDVIGKTHGFNLGVTNNFSTVLTTITLATGDFTIDMDKAATPAKDVKPGDTEVVLATLTLKSNGENATLSEIDGAGFYIVNNATTTVLLENVEMVDKTTGGVYDLSVATSSGKHELTMSDEIALVQGVTKTFDIRADVLDIVPENDTFKVTLEGTALTIEGDVSGSAITDITPSSISGSIITVKNASLTLSPVVLTNLSVVGGATNQVVYQAKVKAGTADGVNIQTLKLTAASSAVAYGFNDSNITQLDLYLDGNPLRTVSNQINESTKTITFNSLNTAYNTVVAGDEVDLVVKATFSSNLTAGDFKLSVDADGDMTARSVEGSDPVVPSTISTDSRVVTTVEKGTLNVALVVTDVKANKDSFLLAGSRSDVGRYLGEIKFTTANEDVRVETLTLNQLGDATNQDIQEVKLVTADDTVIATQTVASDGDAVFDPFDVVFDADETTSLFIVAVAKGMNVNGDPTATARYNKTVQYDVTTVTATGYNSGEDITESMTGDGSSKTATIVGSKLNTVVNALTDGTLGGGTKVIGKYTFVFDNGDNRNTANEALKAILSTSTITVSKSDNVSITNAKMYLEGSASNYADATGDTGTTTTALVWSSASLASLADGGKLDGTVTLVIEATVTPSTDTGEFVQTSIADLNGSGSDDDIWYIGDGLTTSDGLTNMFLPVASVNGGTLNE